MSDQMNKTTELPRPEETPRSDRSERLTRPDIVEAAKRITAREGLDSLTMRKLADELGVTSMAPYYYVRNKDELIDLVTEAVMSAVPVPDPSSGRWDERLWTLNRESRRVIAKYPGLAEALMTRTRPESSRRLTQVTIGLLREAGFDESEAVVAYNTFNALMFGRIAVKDGDHAGRRGEDEFYRWAFDTLIAGFKARLAGDIPT